MTIVGHGIDLLEIAQLQRWIDDPRDPFVPRCFAQAEVDEVGVGPNRLAGLAGRFAAKEAVLKALGTGFGAGVAFTDVMIRRSIGCPPEVHLTGGAVAAANSLGVTGWWLSISHTETFAIASAIAVGGSTHPATFAES